MQGLDLASLQRLVMQFTQWSGTEAGHKQSNQPSYLPDCTSVSKDFTCKFNDLYYFLGCMEICIVTEFKTKPKDTTSREGVREHFVGWGRNPKLTDTSRNALTEIRQSSYV